MFSAVVCGYSEVGYRCLKVLIERGVSIPLVLTHRDSADEQQWYGSVAGLAAQNGLAVETPSDPNAPPWPARIGELAPHYLLCFYYRHMLGAQLLAAPRWAALNMHGSLLPRYRGRAPVNWAILNGESRTGATLHYMVAKPDAGPIVGQEAVAIGVNDTALTVSVNVAAAAARLLDRLLPLLAAGPPAGKPMDLAQGSYFGGRRPEDGRINWSWPAKRIHDLIRAVAPPFPGAFTEVAGQRIVFDDSRWLDGPAAHPHNAPCLYVGDDACLYLGLRDGVRLAVSGVSIAGEKFDAAAFGRRHGRAALPLEPHSA